MEPNQRDSPSASIVDGASFKPPSWEQVGGTETMHRVVDLFVDRAVADPHVNYDRGGTYPQSQETIARTKSLALAFLSCTLGGPLSYNGRPLAVVHLPMAINAKELDAFVEHFQDAMRDCGLPPSVISKLMVAIAAVRPSISVG
jgi:truncated hemoglobin YjbI